MEKLAVLAIILGLISTTIIALTLTSATDAKDALSEKNLPYTHSHTKAICDSKNLCQDYEIFCKKEHVIEISPITGAAIQFPTSWKDPRTEETRSEFC